MALPVVTSVTPNGGPVVGGTAVVIIGTALTGATSVKVGGFPLTSVVVVSSTEITGKTSATSAVNTNVYTSGPLDTIVTTPEGSNVPVVGDVYVYWPTQNPVVVQGDRQIETVAVGSAKVAGAYPAGSPVSFQKAAGAENITFPLRGNYSNVEYIELEANFPELENVVKPKIFLEDSIDGGLTWNKTEGFTETEAVAGTPLFVKGVFAEKEYGPLLRVAIKYALAGGIAGTMTLVTEPPALLRK